MSTRLELEEEVYIELQDPTKKRWGRGVVQRWLQRGDELFTLKAKHNRDTLFMGTVAGQKAYDLSAFSPLILDIKSVGIKRDAVSSEYDPLHYVEQSKLDNRAIDVDFGGLHWREWDGEPWHYTRFAVGFSGIVLVGAPANTVASGLRLEVAKAHVPMTNDNSVPTTPQQFQYALVNYAVARCLRMQSPQESIQRASIYFQGFEDALATCLNEVATDFQKSPVRTVPMRRKV